MTLSLLATGPASAAPAAPAPTPPRPTVTVPFAVVGDHIVVNATMNGRAGRFILDTGSGAASVVPGYAHGLDLGVHGSPVQASGAGQGTTEIRMGAARELKIGTVRFENVTVLVLTADPFKPLGQPMAGALGYDVFAKWTVAIDFTARTLRFMDPAGYRVPRGAIVLPTDLSMRVPIVTVDVRARPSSSVKHAKLVVDTGTSNFAVLFGKDFAQRAHIDTISPRRTLGLGSGSGGLSIGDVMRVAEVTVGGLTLNGIVAGVPGDKTGFFASGVADGTIGQGLFRRGRLTVDYPHNRIVFEPGPDVGEPWEYPDRCGWTLGKDAAGDWAVLYVGVNTPASEAGVLMGDKVTMLGGRMTKGMDRDALRAACNGDGDLALTLRRGTATASPTIHRRKLI